MTEETSGDYQEFLLMILEADQETKCSDDMALAVSEMHDAMDGLGTDETSLMRAICKACPEMWAPDKLPAAYAERWGDDLVEKVRSETSGNFEDALVMKMKGGRFEVWAELLHKAGPEKLGTDEKTITRILSTCQTAGLSYREALEKLMATYDSKWPEQPLIAMLEDELSFNFEVAVLELFRNHKECVAASRS